MAMYHDNRLTMQEDKVEAVQIRHLQPFWHLGLGIGEGRDELVKVLESFKELSQKFPNHGGELSPPREC
jgi:hypothetical protein